ncbi:MAG TPA: TIGR03936 family radical SAM-associated protein [Anaerolineales bacterium]
MRIRITFSKTGSLIYIGNLDLHTLWERAARRAGLPLAYSHGFHPQPRIQFAAPLPLGFSSHCEVLEMRLTEDVDLRTLPARLDAALPEGVRVLAVESANEGEPSLPARVLWAEYSIELTTDVKGTELQHAVEELLSASTVSRERRGRAYDLRRLVEDIRLLEPSADGEIRLHMRLTAQEGATGRPDEVLDALGVPRDMAHIERTALGFRPFPVELARIDTAT